jgi:hypothetical protein
MVEYVEELTPELQGHCFRNGNNLRYSEICVVEARAMEEPPISCPERSAISTRQNPRRPWPIREYQSAGGCGK